MLDTFRKTKQALLTLLLLVAPMFAICAMAQTNSISGRITSAEDGEPLPFVNVSIKGTTTGTVSDIDGNFNIKANKGDILVFSFIDFKTQEVVVADQTNIPVVLESDNQLLDEVVAVGYGVMKKSDLTGAVASIKADQLKKTPASGLDQALQGRAAGVTVNANSGQPGAAAQVRIRGIGSVVGDCSPIYVVDGVITDNISFLAPTDIQSTEVLKDASATAIYGSRGANGVILVTTKTGTRGEGHINVDAYWGLQNRWRKLDLMSRDEMAITKLRIDAMKNSAQQLAYFVNEDNSFNDWMNMFNIPKSKYSPAALSTKYKDGFDYSKVDTDWQDEVFNSNALIQSYSISGDGANENGSFALSANYFNQDGTIIGSEYQRLTFRVNSDYKIKKWLKLGEHASFAYSEGRNAMNNNSSPGASIISAALAMAPWDPTHYPEGSVSANGARDLSNQIAASTNFKNVTNPFSMVEHSNPEDKTERLVADIFMDINPIDGLTWHSALSFDFNLIRSRLFKEKYVHSDYDKADKNFLSSSMRRYHVIGEESTVTYNKSIDIHDFSIMAGETIEEYQSYNIGGSGASILNPSENNWFLNKTTEDKTEAGDGVARSRRFSMLGRLHYSLANKYMITFNFRADGSSKFPNNTWGYFPSTAIAWRISEEDFINTDGAINSLKLRLGWGRVGNDKVGDNIFNQTMFTSGPSFVGYTLGVNPEVANGSAVLTLVNTNGKWETNEQWNAGFDFALFNALSGSVDWFLRDTKDALLYVNAPAHVGNRYSPMKNVGVLRNQGVEISLDYSNKAGDLSYSIGGNVSFIKNELSELNGGQPIWGDRTVCNKGLSMNTFWGYKYLGIYQSDEEAVEHQWQYKGREDEIPVHAGDAKYLDLDKNGIIDDNDRTDLGNPFPWLTYGINMSANWKGFDLQLFFQGVYGNKIYNALRERTEGTGDECTLSTSMRNVWIGYNDIKQNSMINKYDINPEDYENRKGTIPNPAGASSNKYNSDRLVEDGAYFRLKNVQLGYTLPKEVTRKINFDKIRLYVSGSNLFTVTDYTGYDPEVGGGVDYGNYPQSRTVMFGLNLSL